MTPQGASMVIRIPGSAGRPIRSLGWMVRRGSTVLGCSIGGYCRKLSGGPVESAHVGSPCVLTWVEYCVASSGSETWWTPGG